MEDIQLELVETRTFDSRVIQERQPRPVGQVRTQNPSHLFAPPCTVTSVFRLRGAQELHARAPRQFPR